MAILRGYSPTTQSVPVPPSGGDVVLLGDAVVGDGSEASGVYTITGRGSVDPDDGSWWPLQTIAAGSNCQMTWRMNTALTGASLGSFSGCGIQFRVATDDNKLIMNWWPNAGRMRWKYRDADTGSVVGGILGASAATIPYYGSIVYDNTYPRAQLWESSIGGTDPDDWTLVTTIDIDLSAGFDAGLYLVGEQANAVTVTGVIDNVNITTQITLIEATTVPTDPPAPPDPNSSTYNTGLDLTYNAAWRGTADIVLGYDWSLPAGVTPAARSGVFQSGTTWPTFWTGNKVAKINADWKDLEVTENNYTISYITDAFTTAISAGNDGCLLNVRTNVTAIEDAAGDPTKPEQLTAPTWMRTGYPTQQEGLHGSGVRITNLLISDSGVKSRILDLIDAIDTANIGADSRLFGAILHGVSSSQGEEWTGQQASTQAAVDAQLDIIDAWGVAFGADSDKLSWMKENPTSLHDRAVITNGMGLRGGAIENWMLNKYTPYSGGSGSDETGQSYNATNGHLEWDENCLPMAENRCWLDENEAGYSGGSSTRSYHYRAANLRQLQMRRNLAWQVTDMALDPRMDNWLSLCLGKTAATSTDAFVWLMRSNAYVLSTGAQTINNFERWLTQYESQGATTPTSRRNWDKNVNNDNRLISSLWWTDTARMGTSIGITVAPAFITGADSVAIKVTYQDVGTTSWTLEYDTGAGIGTGTGTCLMEGTGDIRTVTFFFTDFQANGGATNKSFTLDDSTGAVPFVLVRVIKV